LRESACLKFSIEKLSDALNSPIAKTEEQHPNGQIEALEKAISRLASEARVLKTAPTAREM